MSRRRTRTPGEATAQIYCDGSRNAHHATYRIAHCTTWTEPFTPGVVRVRYVHEGDRASAHADRTRWSEKLEESPHVTWWFKCGVCPQKRPISADHLADMIRRFDMLNVTRVSLADIAG